nr:hypothetical protein Iba_chr09dCG12610 [Ipomoea batatas]
MNCILLLSQEQDDQNNHRSVVSLIPPEREFLLGVHRFPSVNGVLHSASAFIVVGSHGGDSTSLMWMSLEFSSNRRLHRQALFYSVDVAGNGLKSLVRSSIDATEFPPESL